MKPNTAALLGPIKVALLGHGEKVVFGIAACFALYLFCACLYRKPYAETPDTLIRRAEDLAARVARSTAPESFAELDAKRELRKQLRNARRQVNPAWFPMSELARPYSDRKVRRRQPKLLAVEDVRVYAGFGAIALGEQDLGRERFESGRRGARWTLASGDPRSPGASLATGNYGNDSPQPAPFGSTAGNPAFRSGAAAALPGYGGGSPPGQTSARRGGRRFNDRRARSRRPPPSIQSAMTARLEPENFTLEVPRGAKLEGRYWIAIVGLIPVQEQEAEFRRTFRDAIKTFSSDVPLYLYCDVERAEVGSDGDWRPFEMLDMEQAADDIAHWAAVYPEPVDSRYLPQSVDVAGPPPPLVFADHDPDRIRHPLIPLAAAAAERRIVALPSAKAPPAPEMRRHRMTSRGRAIQPRVRQSPASAMGAQQAGDNALTTVAKQDSIERQLLRFFDFSVQPGHVYQYRVRLALYNPNYSAPPYYLADPKLAADPEIFTEWSQPTAAALVPAGNELLAGGVEPAEPKANVLVRHFDSAQAITAVHVFQMSRGSTANADGVETSAPYLQIDSKAPRPPRTKVDIKTDATMVDLVGGGPLVGGPEGTKAPARILVMDSHGDLAMLSQAADAARFASETARLEAALPKRTTVNPRR